MKKSDLEKENKYLREKVRFLEKYMYDLLKEVNDLRNRNDNIPWGIGGPNISPYIPPQPINIPSQWPASFCQHLSVIGGYCTSCGMSMGNPPWTTVTSSGTNVTLSGKIEGLDK